MELEKAVSLKYHSAVGRLLLDWLNGVLPHFQQYFNHITATAHIIHDFLHQYYAGALKCLAQGYSHEKTQRIHCGSNPGPLDYESNILPLSYILLLLRGEAVRDKAFRVLQGLWP